jgi:hypothetical protein
VVPNNPNASWVRPRPAGALHQANVERELEEAVELLLAEVDVGERQLLQRGHVAGRLLRVESSAAAAAAAGTAIAAAAVTITIIAAAVTTLAPAAATIAAAAVVVTAATAGCIARSRGAGASQ